MATHMLENGADIRFIQAILGHSDLDTTAIYTQVSIHKLKEVHAATHPAKSGTQDPPSPGRGLGRAQKHNAGLCAPGSPAAGVKERESWPPAPRLSGPSARGRRPRNNPRYVQVPAGVRGEPASPAAHARRCGLRPRSLNRSLPDSYSVRWARR